MICPTKNSTWTYTKRRVQLAAPATTEDNNHRSPPSSASTKMDSPYVARMVSAKRVLTVTRHAPRPEMTGNAPYEGIATESVEPGGRSEVVACDRTGIVKAACRQMLGRDRIADGVVVAGIRGGEERETQHRAPVEDYHKKPDGQRRHGPPNRALIKRDATSSSAPHRRP